MPPKEMEKLEKSIQKFGYVDPIIYNKRTGHVVGGNQRLAVLKKLNYQEVDVVEVDLSLEEEKTLNLALNKIAGTWEFDKLTDILEELQSFDELIECTGFESHEIDNLFGKIKLRQTNEEIDLDDLEEGLTCECPRCGFKFNPKL